MKPRTIKSKELAIFRGVVVTKNNGMMSMNKYRAFLLVKEIEQEKKSKP